MGTARCPGRVQANHFMSSNPLFPSSNPLRPEPADDAAVRLIRHKVAQAYSDEPAAMGELNEAKRERTLSKHQAFMLQLSQAGKSLAEIQTEWHHYYTQLPDNEKREVWEEFYAANQHTPYQKLFQKQQAAATPRTPQVIAAAPPQQALSDEPYKTVVADHSNTPATEQPTKSARKKHPHTAPTTKSHGSTSSETSRRLRQKIRNTVSSNGKLKAKHHVQSLMFGLGMGFLVVVILLFGFFNEYIIAPFIQPSRNVGSTPVIVSNIASQATASPTIIIPKINIQIPVDFTLTSNKEAVIQDALSNGIVHYPSTVKPGQNGNAAFFGHSSRNIFTTGKYRYAFAFVLLHQLTTGDVFYITYQGKIYAYQVFTKEIVSPKQVSVLNDTKGKQATAILVTCDPPGFNTNRLVVWGEQISPSPITNTAPATPTTEAPAQITSNGPTLWTTIIRKLEFWQ